MRFCLQTLAALILVSGVVIASEPNETLKPGDAAPVWKDLPGIDGKKHSLADLKDKDVVVVVFTCNGCPTAVGYEERIMAFAARHARPDSKVALVAINVNTVPGDRLPKMQERAKEKGFTFPYLYDETQKIAKDFGANYTPEFFVLNKDRKVVYMGAMDDRNEAKDAKVDYLGPAVQAALNGVMPRTAETPGRGCQIRYVRERRK